MSKDLYLRSLRKLKALAHSFLFRARHHIFLGTVRADAVSISQSSFGKSVIIRGTIASYESSIVFGEGVAIASSSEVGADNSSVIILGDNVIVGPRSIISTSFGKISIGRQTSFFSDCLATGDVDIGEACLIAKNVTLLSGTHQIRGEGSIRENDAASLLDPNFSSSEPIVIGDDCWLGSNSVVLPGVNLGKGVVVGANSVVTTNFPDFSIVAGVPAKVIGSRKS